VLLAVCLTCLLTGPRQVSRRENLIADGDRQLFDRGNARAAEALYLQAAGADPLSADPYLRLSQLARQRWQLTSGARREEQFQQAIEWGQAAIERNPGDITGYRLLGEFHLERFRKTAQPDDAVAAVDEFAQAIARYPNRAALQVQMAEALSAAGQTKAAAIAAQRALDLHEISRQAGHTDKLLPREQVDRMHQLAAATEPQNEQ
jgi:tetratricopeptide (TPR) repeat protein